jgi:hypothetical protein
MNGIPRCRLVNTVPAHHYVQQRYLDDDRSYIRERRNLPHRSGLTSDDEFAWRRYFADLERYLQLLCTRRIRAVAMGCSRIHLLAVNSWCLQPAQSQADPPERMQRQ